MGFSLLLLTLQIWAFQGHCDIVYPDEEEPEPPETTFSYIELAKDVLTEIDTINKKLKDVFGKTEKVEEEKHEEKVTEDYKIKLADYEPKVTDKTYRSYDTKQCDCKCECADTSVVERRGSSFRNTLQAAGKMIKNKIHGMTS
uniref:Uncharacterized protein n=1 Tax=Clastoptera arizonana TaxID=38151 RepID=A0A1B6CY02_9HEMI